MRDEYFYNERGYNCDHYFEEVIAYLCGIDDKLEKLVDVLTLENAVKKKRRHGKVGSP